jgi:hypothetical protein
MVTRHTGVTPFAAALANAREHKPAYVPIVVEHQDKWLAPLAPHPVNWGSRIRTWTN